jgi:hypothetical protein
LKEAGLLTLIDTGFSKERASNFLSRLFQPDISIIASKLLCGIMRVPLFIQP